MLDLLKTGLRTKPDRKLYWVGARRGVAAGKKEKWHWDIPTNTTIPTRTQEIVNRKLPWGLQEPGTVGDCVAVDSAHQWLWNSVGCSISAHVVCQNEGVQRYKNEKF